MKSVYFVIRGKIPIQSGFQWMNSHSVEVPLKIPIYLFVCCCDGCTELCDKKV